MSNFYCGHCMTNYKYQFIRFRDDLKYDEFQQPLDARKHFFRNKGLNRL